MHNYTSYILKNINIFKLVSLSSFFIFIERKISTSILGFSSCALMYNHPNSQPCMNLTLELPSLGRKFMTNLDSILKSRDISLPKKVHLVKTMVFPVVMYGCKSWTVKKAECQRIDAFELWYWRRHLQVPWTSRRSNKSILKEINSECSLEGLMLRLKLQYFGHLI